MATKTRTAASNLKPATQLMLTDLRALEAEANVRVTAIAAWGDTVASDDFNYPTYLTARPLATAALASVDTARRAAFRGDADLVTRATLLARSQVAALSAICVAFGIDL